MYIINEPINEIPMIEKIKFIPKIDMIDKLYSEKNYDECCYLINFIIKHRFSYNYTFIYKTLVLIDKVNYIIHSKEIESLLTLLDTDNFEDIFNVCVVLVSNKFKSLAYQQFDKLVLFLVLRFFLHQLLFQHMLCLLRVFSAYHQNV